MTRPARTGSRPRVRHTWAAVLMGLVLIQLCALYWPRVDVAGGPAWADKAVHATLFALPTLAAGLTFRRWLLPVTLLGLHAPVSEVLQHLFLPHRSGDPLDVLADLVGVALGAFASGRLRPRAGRNPGAAGDKLAPPDSETHGSVMK